jgi:hypothetical protein
VIVIRMAKILFEASYQNIRHSELPLRLTSRIPRGALPDMLRQQNQNLERR